MHRRAVPSPLKIAVLPDPATDPYTQRVRTEQVRLLYTRIPLDIVASLLIAPALVFIVWSAIPPPVLLTWLVLTRTKTTVWAGSS